MKRDRIIFYIATGLLSVLMLFSVSMYFFKHDDVSKMFEGFGYPIYIIYPYAIAKLLGLFAIWNPNLKTIKEWAYSGFFFAFILAFFAHYMIGDGEQAGALLALILLVVSYVFNSKINKFSNSIKR
ncbi:DoxX family protein [Snuella lapsa]|uniref:DoxX family protein n=1 Tax=Snuella lapsa TaxID=870481 RepID=A0ABP6WU07_9FLAO